jgi:hypothetical protein
VVGPVWRPSVHLLGDLLLCLQYLAQHFGLGGMKASDGVMGGGGDKSPLPLAPKPLGELRVVPTI